MISVINVFEFSVIPPSVQGGQTPVTSGSQISKDKTQAEKTTERKTLQMQKLDIDNQQKTLQDRERQILQAKSKI